jgi:hypothetical protein
MTSYRINSFAIRNIVLLNMTSQHKHRRNSLEISTELSSVSPTPGTTAVQNHKWYRIISFLWNDLAKLLLQQLTCILVLSITLKPSWQVNRAIRPHATNADDVNSDATPNNPGVDSAWGLILLARPHPVESEGLREGTSMLCGAGLVSLRRCCRAESKVQS